MVTFKMINKRDIRILRQTRQLAFTIIIVLEPKCNISLFVFLVVQGNSCI